MQAKLLRNRAILEAQCSVAGAVKDQATSFQQVDSKILGFKKAWSSRCKSGSLLTEGSPALRMSCDGAVSCRKQVILINLEIVWRRTN